MDNFFTRIFRREVVQTSGEAAGTATANGGNGHEAGGGTYAQRIAYARNPQAALAISGVYRAVELRANTIGQMLMQYQKRSKEGGNYVADITPPAGGYVTLGTRLNYLLQKRPNPMMTASSLFKQMSIQRLMQGNAFCYIERDESGMPLHLWLATCAGYDYANNTYTLNWMTERGLVTKATVQAEDVIHWPNTFRDNQGFWGISTLQYAAKTLSLIATESQQALESAAKGGRIKGFIGEEKPAQGAGTLAFGLINKGSGDDYARELSDKVYQQDITFLRGLDKWVPLSMSSADMQMIEWMQLSLDDVARYFGVPRPLLMLDSNSHYTTPTAATQEFHLRTIQPDARELEDEFETKLLNVYDFGIRRFHLCEQPLFRLDPETQAKVAKLKMEGGICSVNENRADFDMPEVANGDIVYVSTNLAELGSEKLRSTGAGRPATEPEPPKEPPTGGEEPPKEGGEGA